MDWKTAAAEVFWDQKPDPADPPAGPRVARVCQRHHIAQLHPKANVKLLSLREDDDFDAIDALPELITSPSDEHPLTREWAKAIFEDLGLAGIRYRGAHQLGECIVLWENAPGLAIVVDDGVERVWPLHRPDIWARMLGIYESSKRTMVKITPAECPQCRSLGLR